MKLKRFLKKLLGRETCKELVLRLFPEDQQDVAIRFYESWADRELLLVDLGDGLEEPTRESFYDRASFLFCRPSEVNGYLLLGIPTEDDEASVIMDRKSGIVYYAAWWPIAEDAVEIAENFEEFLLHLKTP